MRALTSRTARLWPVWPLIALQACVGVAEPTVPSKGRCGDAGDAECQYDPAVAWARISVDFCGRSPTFEELSDFRSQSDPFAAIHEALELCLASEHWKGKDGVLWNLGNDKIQPTASVKSGENAGVFAFGDYDDDYRLFVWANSGDRDVRDLLLADYHVTQTASGELEAFQRTPEEDFALRGDGGAQLVRRDRRAGMLTTRWFLMKNIMFSAVPRVAAAQAYRSYLGAELAQFEGMHGTAGTLADYDEKGITQPECAVCHATLDPLTYPFTRYEGMGGGDMARASGKEVPLGVSFLPFSYSPSRLERFAGTDGETVGATPEAGSVLGEPVRDLVEWATVAANSDEFARKVVLDFWRHLVGADPLPDDADAFDGLVLGLMTTHEYRVERMLHALVETSAYGTGATPMTLPGPSRLKARSGDVIAMDLAEALDLPRDALCREFGVFDCFDKAHRIALGGVEPYVLGVNKRDSLPSVSAPVVLDRVVLAACTERAKRDFDQAGEGLFAPLTRSGSRQTLEQIAAKLVTRMLKRAPQADEVAALADFVDEAGPGDTALRDWAIGICLALGTHDESVFY